MTTKFRVPVGTVKYTARERKAVLDVIQSNQLSPGNKCHEFKQKFAQAHGAKHGLIVNSGTDALRIALAAMKEKYHWKRSDRVAIPAVTFVATMNVVIQNQLTPVLVDANINGFCQPIPRDVKAVIPVHLCGRRLDLTKIKRTGVKILEDSCECMGVGNIQGDVACYSTYVCHLISTGVGGLSITNDQELYNLMWSYANHGRSLEKNADIKKRFLFERIGYSSRATEFEAALGLEQLKRLPQQIRRRRQIAQRYIEELKGPFWVPETLENNHAYMMFPVVVNEGVNKWDFCEYLERNGIETRELLPLTNQPCYKNLIINKQDFTEADRINRNGFYMGCHPQMTDSDVTHVIKTFRRYVW